MCSPCCRFGEPVRPLVTVYTNVSWYMSHFEVDFGCGQSRQCASQYLSEIGILKSTSQPGPPVSFPQVHPLVHAIRTDLAISKDNQATKICRPCHRSSHCQDDGRGLSPVVGLHPPVKDGADIEIRPLAEPDTTVGAPASSP